MITKKLKGQVFIWNPNAFNGKGYWFVLGKNGSYGKAASKRQAGYLSRPTTKQIEDTSPEEETPEKEISGNTQSTLGKLKDKFNPKNMMKMFKPLGEKATTNLNEEKDQSEFFGKSIKTPAINSSKIGTIDKAFYATVAPNKIVPIRKGESIANVSAKILSLFNKTYEEKKLQRELNKNFEEERQLEDKKRHENLIKEIYKAKGMKRPSKGKVNKTSNKLKDWSDIKNLKIETGSGGIGSAVRDAAKTAAQVAVGVTGAFVAGGVMAKIAGSESQGSYTIMNILPGESKTGTYEAQAGRAKLGGGTYEKSLTDMTLGEVIELGKQRSALSGTKGGGSAAGKYQFMPATIAGLGPKVFGKNWQSVPFNKENQDKMAEALLQEEVASLKRNGVPVSEATIYMTHLTGDGAKVKRIMDPANEDKKMSDVVPELAGSNNDTIANMTVKQYKDSLAKKFSYGALDETMTASDVSTSTKVSSHFYRDSGELHGAIDIPGKQGQPIFSTGEGTVIYGNNDPNGFGSNWLIIDHGNGLRTTYGHMSERTVENGTKVKAGQQIGKMGNEGRSSGTHLHYQITQNGKNIDPENFNSSLLTPWQASIKGIPGTVQIASDSSKGQQVSSATAENKQLKQNIAPTTVVNNAKTTTEVGKKPNQRILSAGLKQEYPEFMKITMVN